MNWVRQRVNMLRHLGVWICVDVRMCVDMYAYVCVGECECECVSLADYVGECGSQCVSVRKWMCRCLRTFVTMLVFEWVFFKIFYYISLNHTLKDDVCICLHFLTNKLNQTYMCIVNKNHGCHWCRCCVIWTHGWYTRDCGLTMYTGG